MHISAVAKRSKHTIFLINTRGSKYFARTSVWTVNILSLGCSELLMKEFLQSEIFSECLVLGVFWYMTYLYVAYCKGRHTQRKKKEERALWLFRHLNNFKTKDLGFKSGRNQNGPKFVDDTMYRKCVVRHTTLPNSSTD